MQHLGKNIKELKEKSHAIALYVKKKYNECAKPCKN